MEQGKTGQDNEKSDSDSFEHKVNSEMEEPEKGDVKMAGYLEKRGKMKLVSTWKRYWFVLEGRLLLYYRSQLEYLNLSACRGSLNMGIATCVRPGINRGPVPGPGFIIEVVTRTQVVTLRTKDRAIQEQWLQALLDSMALPNISAPVRNSGGPLHFRYSMDNLPTVDEVEDTKDNAEDKLGTLPHKTKTTTVARRDSVLMRIKRLGGQSHGGSLETILHRRVGNQAQQPKIPRIKAVDRMVGLQDDKASSNTTLDEKEKSQLKDEPSSIIIPLNNNSDSINECNLNEDIPSQESSQTNGTNELQEPIKSAEEKNTHIASNTVSLTSSSSVNKEETLAGVPLERLQDVTESEHKGVKDSATHGEETSEETEKLEYVCIENKLYERSQHEGGKEHESKEKPQSDPNKVEEEGKLYEDVTIASQSQQQEHKMETVKMADEEEEEEEYYSSYDPIILLQNLNEQEEPTLPPRPSVSNPDSPKPLADMHNVYYELGVEVGAPSSPQESLLSGGEGTNKDKKANKSKTKTNLNKKLPSKDTSGSENGNHHKKRRLSFLRRMIKHYRRKAEPEPMGDPESSDEPEYDTVDYSAVSSVSEGGDTSNYSSALQSEDGEQKKDKIVGSASILSNSALQELRQRLKQREDDTEIKGNEEGWPSDEVADKMKNMNFKEDKSKTLNERRISEGNLERDKNFSDFTTKPPKLPPRRIKRPSSPWHDVPTNNSPVYGNFNFQSSESEVAAETTTAPTKSVTETSSKECGTCSRDSMCSDSGEWSQEIEDELLGTPQGFAYIQNKWKAAERSGEWHRELRQVSFPVNARNRGPKTLQEQGDTQHLFKKVQHDKHCKRKMSESENISLDKVTASKDKSDGDAPNVEIYSKIVKRNSDKSNLLIDLSKVEKCSIDHTNKDKCTVNREIREMVQKCSFENLDYISCKGETGKTVSEDISDFQKDSLMTSICTQTESDLQDSIVFVDKCLCEKHSDTQEYKIYGTIPVAAIRNGKLALDEKKDACCREKHLAYDDSETQELSTNRYSDELNLLLAQLAEITSAPLMSPGATKSLTDFPESRQAKPTQMQDLSLADQIALLGPIRRRRHSDPDYDVPRPHHSLLQLALPPSGAVKQPGQDSDVIEATRFFGQGLTEDCGQGSGSMKQNQSCEDADQSELSWTLSMAPDSLEPIPSTLDPVDTPGN